MNNVAANPPNADRDEKAIDADTAMSDSESEVFEDVLPHDAEANDTPVETDGVSIDIDMTSPQGNNYVDDLPTPPESTFAPSVHTATPLPRPRKHPLQAGGSKEVALIGYLDRALDNVGKRITNRHVKELLPGELAGYQSFADVVRDIDPLIDVVWVSGTPTLQLPYLINMTIVIINCVPMFPSLPRTTLNFLTKLDTAFAALLSGHDPETNDVLPGFTNDRGISTTDKVRIKGVVERARSTVTMHLVVATAEEATSIDRKTDNAEKVDEGFVKFEGFDSDNSEDEEEARQSDERRVAHVFEKTLVELGDILGGQMIGLVTDEEQDMRRQLEEEAAALRERAEFQQQRSREFEEVQSREQRQYLEDGRAEFEEEAKKLGEGHEFRAHGSVISEMGE